MSQWRRIALEEVPSCKQVIEESANPDAMWSALYFELTSLEPLPEVMRKQIYGFALCCFRNRKPEILSSSVWIFFHYAVGAYLVGNGRIREDLPKYIATSDFQYWIEALKDCISPKNLIEATKQFHATKYNAN